MHQFFNDEDRQHMGKIFLVLGVVLALYFGMKLINQVKTYGTIGIAPGQVNTIDVTGTGNAYAVPNVATESFTVEDQETTVAAAQDVVNKKVAAALSFLKTSGIADKDVTTTGYSAYPDYTAPCSGTVACPVIDPSKSQQVSGYTVSQSVSVKIRDTSTTGKIIDGLGAAGATGLNGPAYTIDDPDAVQEEARSKAITDAETKAQTLASQLGVHLVRITSFNESTGGNGGAVPMMYAAAGATSSTEAQLPSGQNEYTSNVTITYQIH